MTETGTQTWHELADRNLELENAIQQATRDYARDVSIHTIMDRLKATEANEYGANHEPS